MIDNNTLTELDQNWLLSISWIQKPNSQINKMITHDEVQETAQVAQNSKIMSPIPKQVELGPI